MYKRIINILILVLLTVPIFSQYFEKDFSFRVPALVPLNSQFELSFIGKIDPRLSDQLEIGIVFPESVSLSTLKLCLIKETNNWQNYQILPGVNPGTKFLKIIINTSYVGNNIFQIKPAFISHKSQNHNFTASLVILNENKIIKKFQFTSEKETRFYSNKTTNFSALKFYEGGSLSTQTFSQQLDKPEILFRMKHNNDGGIFFSLNAMNTPVFSLLINDFGMLSVKTSSRINLSETIFLSPECWYTFRITYLKNQRVWEIFCNDQKLFSLYNNLIQDLKITAGNETTGYLVIDKMMLLDYSETHSTTSNATPDYKNNLPNTIIYSTDDFFRGSSDGISEITNYQKINSDFPGLISIPELKITRHQEFVLLETTIEQVLDLLVFEKSENGNDFVKIFETSLNNYSVNQNFSAIDYKSEAVILYRIMVKDSKGNTYYSHPYKLKEEEKPHFSLDQNYPNPFNSQTTFRLIVNSPADFYINIFDAVGVKIQSVYEGHLEKGPYEYSFNGNNLTSGIYFIEVKSGKFTKVNKIILTK